ncbi:hypothetical protein AB6C51_23080 [Vibrio splendidus]
MDITYKLPHPVRIRCTQNFEQENDTINGMYDMIFDGLELESYSLDCLSHIAIKRSPQLWKNFLSQSDTAHNAFIGLSSAILPYKFNKVDGNILTTSNEVDNLLIGTDIGDDIPIAYLRPPFKTCFIEFTEDRTSPIKVYNEETNEHVLEGVYITESIIQPGDDAMDILKDSPEIDETKEVRALDLMFIGSPLGKAHNKDDALRIQGFYIQDNKLTIKSELERIISLYGNDQDFASDMNYLSDGLNHMAKVLLFMNCKQYRDTAFNERKEILKKISSLKSPAKIKKYDKKLRKSYDRLVIKPEDHVVYQKQSKDEQHSDGHSPKKAHWRKGHFRMQPYGPGATQRKVLFIEPTIVGGIFAKTKSYNVREK